MANAVVGEQCVASSAGTRSLDGIPIVDGDFRHEDGELRQSVGSVSLQRIRCEVNDRRQAQRGNSGDRCYPFDEDNSASERISFNARPDLVEGLGHGGCHCKRIEASDWNKSYRGRTSGDAWGTAQGQRRPGDVDDIANITADRNTSSGDRLDRESILFHKRIQRGCDLGRKRRSGVGRGKADNLAAVGGLAIRIEFESDRVSTGRGVGKELSIGDTRRWYGDGELGPIGTCRCIVGSDDAESRLVDKRHFVNAVLTPETCQRCQANGSAVVAIPEDVIDARREHATVFGQYEIVLVDRQWIRTGSLAFIE